MISSQRPWPLDHEAGRGYEGLLRHFNVFLSKYVDLDSRKIYDYFSLNFDTTIADN